MRPANCYASLCMVTIKCKYNQLKNTTTELDTQNDALVYTTLVAVWNNKRRIFICSEAEALSWSRDSLMAWMLLLRFVPG